MDSSSGSSDGDMWKGRAIAFVEALMKVLVAMRDANHILLDANSIRNYFELDRLEAMSIDKAFIRDGQEAVSYVEVASFDESQEIWQSGWALGNVASKGVGSGATYQAFVNLGELLSEQLGTGF